MEPERGEFELYYYIIFAPYQSIQNLTINHTPHHGVVK